MSGQNKEALNFSAVPASRGIQKPTYFILAIGLLGIFIMGGLTVMLSASGHIWPANHTVRICLEQDTSKCPPGTTPDK